MAKDRFTREWITENALEEIQNYENGELTVRGLHYRLVSRGMTNTQRHYKRVVGAMIKARWDGLVPFSFFADNDRDTLGETSYQETTPSGEAESSFRSIKYWLKNYHKNRWENQPNYVEVFIEKKALQGVFDPVCSRKGVALNPCKGYPSLTFLYEAAQRYKDAKKLGKTPVMLYFGDYDPSGEDIPRSIYENLADLGINVLVKRCALMEEQVREWGLPPAPAKTTDSRTANWDGLGQVELDAVELEDLRDLCRDAIDGVFDDDLLSELVDQQEEEAPAYKRILREKIDEFFESE